MLFIRLYNPPKPYPLKKVADFRQGLDPLIALILGIPCYHSPHTILYETVPSFFCAT